jgi:hypothetical protein
MFILFVLLIGCLNWQSCWLLRSYGIEWDNGQGIMKWKKCERKQSCPKIKYSPDMWLERLRKTTKTSENLLFNDCWYRLMVRWLMSGMVEQKLGGEIKVLGENLSTINITGSSLESNTGHRDVSPATNRLSSVTALTSAMRALLRAETWSRVLRNECYPLDSSFYYFLLHGPKRSS